MSATWAGQQLEVTWWCRWLSLPPLHLLRYFPGGADVGDTAVQAWRGTLTSQWEMMLPVLGATPQGLGQSNHRVLQGM